MKKTKSDYIWYVSNGYLKIEDLNLGGRSVTNDIENVLYEIREEIGDQIEKFQIIYKDSDELWNFIDTSWISNENVRVNFRPINI